jgi:membrane protease YdiL (CAAX protease family)
MTARPATSPRTVLIAAGNIALAIVPLGVGLTVATMVGPAGDPGEPQTLALRILIGVVLSALTLAVLALLIRFADGGQMRATSWLPGPGAAWRLAAVGAALWLVPAAATFGVLALFGGHWSVTATVPELALTVALLALAVLLTEAIPEELVFRGYVTSVLGTVARGWWVIGIQAVLFTVVAGLLRQNWNPLDLSLFVSMGVGLGYLRMVTGSVWMPVGFHAAFQTGAQLVLSHDDVEFAGGAGAAMLALGVVPFAVAAIIVSSRPRLFHAREAAAR